MPTDIYPGEQILSPAEMGQLRRGEVVGPLKSPSPSPSQPASSSQGPLFSSPKGFFGPGLLTNLKDRYPKSSLPAFRALYDVAGQADVRSGIKTPETARRRAGQFAEATGGAALSMAAPNPASILGRAGIQGGVAGLQAIGQGQSPLNIATQGGIGAGLNLLLSGLGAPGKLAINALIGQRAGKRFQAGTKAWEQRVGEIKAANIERKATESSAYKQQVRGIGRGYAEQVRTGRAQHAAQKQQAESAYETAVATQEAEFASKMRAHSEKTAARVAQDIQAGVPVLRGSFSPDEKGLISMLYGRGRRIVSREFDTAMQKAAEKAERLPPLTIPIRTAQDLGVPIQGRTETITDPLGSAVVNAKDLIASMAGKSLKRPEAYRQAAETLDAAGIGDEGARSMYRTWAGYRDFANKTGMIRYDTDLGRYIFDYQKGLGGLVSPKANLALERRGLGNVDDSALLSGLGGPLKPSPLQKPIIPPYIRPPTPQYPPSPVFRPTPLPPEPPSKLEQVPGFKTRSNPFAGHPIVGGIAGGALGHEVAGAYGHVPGFLLGAALSKSLPKDLVTQAPLNPTLLDALRRSPGILNALTRGIYGPQ